jgi:Yip1 domain
MDSSAVIESDYARILVRPRATIRTIVDRDPRERVIALVAVAGFIGAVSAALQLRSPQAFAIGTRAIPAIVPATLWKIRIAQVIASPVLAVVFLYINGAILRWSGALFGGTAKAVEVRAALGWSSVPSILSSLILIVFTLLYPPSVVALSQHSPPTAILARELPRLGFIFALAAYVFVIYLNCLAEVHRFSAWRALGAAAIQWLLVMGASMVLLMTVPLVAVFLFR